MGHLNIWIHLVWATKNREPLLTTKDLRQTVFNHIRNNGREKSIHIDFVNGYHEHAHALLSLSASQSISKIAQMIKGESSFWINDNKLLPRPFEWQDDYFAESVSPLQLNVVRDYIRNQEVHHQKISFQQEYDAFMKKNGVWLKDDESTALIKIVEEPVNQIAARL